MSMAQKFQIFFSVGLTHLDINLEPAVGKETNVDDLWDDRDEVRKTALVIS